MFSLLFSQSGFSSPEEIFRDRKDGVPSFSFLPGFRRKLRTAPAPIGATQKLKVSAIRELLALTEATPWRPFWQEVLELDRTIESKDSLSIPCEYSYHSLLLHLQQREFLLSVRVRQAEWTIFVECLGTYLYTQLLGEEKSDAEEECCVTSPAFFLRCFSVHLHRRLVCE